MFGTMTIDTDDRLVKRAIAAYVRTSEAASPELPSDSGVADLDGKIYVVLENASRILAIYRVRNDGMLKRLRRWPIELDTFCASVRAAGPEGRWVIGEDLKTPRISAEPLGL
jgi:hypothetical protein